MRSRHSLLKLGALSALLGALWLLVGSSAQAPATVVAARVPVERATRGEESATMTVLAQIAEHRALPPLEHFQAAAARPLFAPDRRPAERLASPVREPESVAETAGAQPSREPLALRLVGTVIRGNTGHALIARGPRLEQVQRGSIIEGWEVVDVGLDRLVLVRDGESRALHLLR